jgi:hypothetical protein
VSKLGHLGAYHSGETETARIISGARWARYNSCFDFS